MEKIVKQFGNSLGISFDSEDKELHNISQGDVIDLNISNIKKQKSKSIGGKEKIVYAYVCGDILHRGHLLHLKNAKAMGDKLIVGVLTDEAIMEKKSRPVMSYPERLELVSSLKMVDMAVIQEKYSPHDNVLRYRPDILMESDSHSNELIKESEETMKKIGGKVIVSPYYNEQSSTNIKNRIKEQMAKNKQV